MDITESLIYPQDFQKRMTSLVACIGADQKAWGHVARLIKDQEWENVYLIMPDEAKSFVCDKSAEYIIIDTKKPVKELIIDIIKALQDKVSFQDVALNLVSGSGKEHMAILSALLKLGAGIRLVAVTKDGIEEI